MKQIAAFLLEIEAVRFNVEQPFVWSSGWRSPIYCDNRLILSYPHIRTAVKDAFSALLEEKFGKEVGIAGVATAGIAHGALIADKLALPYLYVRSSPKAHGMKNMIEGRISPNLPYVVIEDLVSTGGSSMKVVEALRENEAEVAGMLAIFSYGFEQADLLFQNAKVPFFTLTNFDTLIEVAVEKNYLSSDQISTLQNWRKAPDKF